MLIALAGCLSVLPPTNEQAAAKGEVPIDMQSAEGFARVHLGGAGLPRDAANRPFPAREKKMLQLALEGNPRCLQYLVDRLMPQRRSRPLELQLPTINGVHDIAPAIAAITNGVNNGNLTAEEASHFIRVLESYENAIITNDFAIRLENVESQMKKTNRG